MAKILVVDDSEIIRFQLAEDLSAEGHEVLQAVDGLNGLEVISEHDDIKLIICDVNMPEMDGITMCEQVSKDESRNKIPIVMLTTQNSPEMKAKGKAYGVVAWVTKPYKAAALLGGVKKLVGQ
jgi:two-component system chemotaxis response regulator CheY